MAPQISIVGAGIAGLVLGQCLRRRQIPAVIFEKSKQIPALQNFGITLRPSVHQSLLRHLELDDNAFASSSAIGPDTSLDGSIRVNRSGLLRTLAKGLDIRWDHKLVDLTRDAGTQHKLVFESGSSKQTHESDIVLVADGVHSAARNSLHLNKDVFQLEVLPFVVFNGKRRLAKDNLPDGLEGCLSADGMSYSVGNVLLQITSGYATEDELAINYTLSRPAEQSDDDLLGRSNSDAETLARRFLDEAGKLSDLKEPFRTVFDPAAMKNDRLLHWLMRSALIDAETAETLAKEGIVLLGDAASPQPILGGAGANAAILDALSVANAIDEAGRIDLAKYNDLQNQWKVWKADAEKAIQDMHQHAARASI